jgi:hypothetical protein
VQPPSSAGFLLRERERGRGGERGALLLLVLNPPIERRDAEETSDSNLLALVGGDSALPRLALRRGRSVTSISAARRRSLETLRT